MGWSWRWQLIRNQNTQGIDERAGNTSRKEDCGEVHENVHSVYCVAVQSHYNTSKYIWIIHNVHNTLENSHIFSTHKLALAAECTEDYKIHKCNKFYYKWPRPGMYSLKVALSCQNTLEWNDCNVIYSK